MMDKIEQLRIAERLIRNLQWLEVGNPLLTIDELLSFGIQYSDRIKQQFDAIKDLYLNELNKMKTLSIMLRYVQDAQLRLMCEICQPPYFEPSEYSDHGSLRMMQLLSGVEYSALSLTTSRGKSKRLGGGSRGKTRTA